MEVIHNEALEGTWTLVVHAMMCRAKTPQLEEIENTFVDPAEFLFGTIM